MSNGRFATETATFGSMALIEAIAAGQREVPWRAVSVRTPMAGTAVPFPPFPANRVVKRRVAPPIETGYEIPTTFLDAWWVHPSRRRDIRLTTPLLHLEVSDRDQDGVFVVSDTFSTAYGAGETPTSAVADYLESVFHHFDWLDRNESTLGRDLRCELLAMRRYLSREP